MAATNLHSASDPGRSNELHALAEQLYALLSSGHDALAYNVDAHGAALTELAPDGRRRPVARGGEGGTDRPAWQRARELVEGVERDRRFNAWVLERHLAGRYSVAPAAAGWVGWVALDIDAHVMPGSPELVGRRLAKERADRVLAGVWRALGCSAERHPLILKSPGAGYHVWLPLTRGPSSSNPEHTWPAAVARAWVERHLVAAGLELAPGVLEVFPSGRCLRAPCGRGMTLLRATRPSDPDALGLVPWTGTMADEQRIDWRGVRPELSTPVRRVVPMVRTFLAQWGEQRRTLADWLGRPEAAWDATWGFLGWRSDEAADLGEISSAEKTPGEGPGEYDSRSQESDDVPGRHGAGGTQVVVVERGGRSAGRRRSAAPITSELLPPSAEEVDLPLDPAGDRLVRGLAFKVKVRRLLEAGITESSTRHDAVLALSFYWAGTCGLPVEGALARLEAWCKAHPHQGSTLANRPRLFTSTCLREAQHYLEHYASRWRFRGHGDGGGLATLATADHAVLDQVDPRVRGEVAALLAWLAGRADDAGRISEPVQIATGLLARLCGDRRIVDGGKRRRASTLALVELERVGVLTMAQEYRVGRSGRTWSCWYQFGSGAVPRAISLPAAQWAELEAPSVVAKAPTLAITAPVEPGADAASAPIVEARVVGERVVPEGLLRVLSDGARGAPRALLTLAPDIARPTATPVARPPWFVRAYQLQPFTPGRLRSADPAMVIAFPDLAARRRMSRRERIAWGGGGSGSGPSGAGAPVAPVIPLPVSGEESSAPAAPGPEPVMAPAGAVPDLAAPAAPGPNGAMDPEEVRAALAAEIGADAAAAVPLELLEVMLRAWGGFRGRARGS
ncbi:MAG TPA: hypothetical protein VFT22_10240 [Kofleriaceae bacterium]|nr:hypothetical protein [Kofleriaceae bacterium]